MKILIVLNPISGGVDKGPFLKSSTALLDKYGINYHIFKTTGKDDEKKLKEVLENYQPDKVLSAGGDGTTLFTAITLLGTNYPIGILPLGSANGMAVELAVNPNPIEALKDAIMSERIAGLDLLKINDQHYCIHLGDVGLNAQIVKGYSEDRGRGMATYAKYFLNELTKIKPFKATIRIGEEIHEENVLLLAMCNARKYGTGVPLNTIGNPMDGKFELVLLTQVNATSLIKAGLARFNENFLDNQTSKVLVAEQAKIEFEEPLLLQLDGEIIGDFKTLDLEILKGAIRFITHGNNAYLREP